MVKYVLYEKSTGKIIQSGFCPAGCLPEKDDHTEILEGVMTTSVENFRVVDGKLEEVN